MQFTIIHPDGRKEIRQHIPYTIKQTGPCEWQAIDPRNGRLLARGYVNAQALRDSCDTCTEHVRYVN